MKSHSQNDFSISKNELIEIYRIFSNRYQHYYILNEYIFSDYFEDDVEDELVKLIDKSNTKPYFIPEKEEYLKFSDDLYFDITPQLIDLKKFILKEFTQDENRANNLIDEIQLLCSMDEPMQDIMDVFENFDIILDSRNQFKRLVPLIMDVKNSTRIWANRGHTPNELSRILGKPIVEKMGPIISLNDYKINNPVRSKKTGRNEPCPVEVVRNIKNVVVNNVRTSRKPNL